MIATVADMMAEPRNGVKYNIDEIVKSIFQRRDRKDRRDYSFKIQ